MNNRWQYRRHRCCDVRKVPSSSSLSSSRRRTCRPPQVARKSNSCGSSCRHVSKKIVQSSKVANDEEDVERRNRAFGTSKSPLVNGDERHEKTFFDEAKPAGATRKGSKLRYLSEYKKKQTNGKRAARPIITEPSIKNKKDPSIRKEISEISNTSNDTKSTVVMEFSTVQKIVQLVDNNGDVSMAKFTVIPARDIIGKKKRFDSDVGDNGLDEDDDAFGTVEKISRSTVH